MLELGGFNGGSLKAPGLLPCLTPRPLEKPVLSFSPGQWSACHPQIPLHWQGPREVWSAPPQTLRNFP